MALCRPSPFTVKSLAGVPCTPIIHECIAGAAVPTLNLTIGVEHAEVGDAANVQHGDTGAGLAKHALVKGRYQGRALAACGQIAAAKVSDYIDARQLGQQRRVDELQRVANGGLMASCIAIELQRAVTHGLAMGANGRHLFRLHASGMQKILDHLCVMPGNRIASQSAAVQFVRPALVELQQLGAEWRFKRYEGVLGDLQST